MEESRQGGNNVAIMTTLMQINFGKENSKTIMRSEKMKTSDGNW